MAVRREVGLGLVGCGFVTCDRHLPALAHVPEVRPMAVADVEPGLAAATAARFGIPGAYGAVEDLLADPAVEAVAVCTPPAAHVDVALAALAAQKHLLVEKTLALSLAEADLLVGEASRAGVVAVAGLNFRQHRFVRRARDLIRESTLGRVEAVRGSFTNPIHGTGEPGWRTRRDEGGGGVHDRAVHHFDLWRYLLDDEVEEVLATTRSGEEDDRAAVVTAVMRGGALATTLVLDDTAVGHELSVYGTAGALHLDLCRFDGFQYARTDAPPGSARARARRLAETLRRPGESARAMRRGGDYRLTYEEQWRRFAAIVRGELPASPSLADGRQALAIALAATESAAVGARVAVNAEVAAQ